MKRKKPTSYKSNKPKSRLTKVDLDAVLKLQRDYDELQADCKDLFNVIVNLAKGEKEPTMVQFNDIGGYLYWCLKLIREHATWNVEPKTEENEQHEV